MTLIREENQHPAAASAAALNGTMDELFTADPDLPAPKKLLVIDDQAGITRVVVLLATEIGLETQAVNVSSQALEAFLAFRPDIVMIDMIMPEKDGIDVLNEILLTGLPTHVVLTTGLSDSYLRLAEAVVKFHEVDRYSVLRKPFRKVDLVAELSRCALAS